MELVEYGQSVIIQKKNQTSLHELPKKQGKQWTVKVGRNQVDLTSAVGKPFGAFKLTPGPKNKKVSVLEPIDGIIALKSELLKDINSGESNQEIWDDGTSQQLKKEDIDRLREKGISGSEIISHLVENSKSFQNKTEFSQEKYVNKKEEKYTECIEIVKPSIRLLAKHLHTQDPMKVLNMRSDTLATLMSLANITAGGKYGILDGGCQGLITAAILDRIQGNGTVWNLYSKGQPQKQAVQAMNFNSEQIKSLQNISLFKLKDLAISKTALHVDTATETEKESMEGNGTETKEVKEESDGPPAKVPKLDPEAKEEAKDTANLDFGTLDSLIVACRRPGNISKELLKLLKPSGNFVLYCPYIEPLSETYMQFRENGLAVNLKLTELWFRNYQVLPLRTHPEVMMSGSGGFLLSGIHVVPV